MFLHVVSSVYKSSCPLIVRGLGDSQSLDRYLPLYQLPASKIKQTFHQHGLFNGFLVASGQTPFSFTLFSSVQVSGSVMSGSLPPNGLQHARPPCPSPTPGFRGWTSSGEQQLPWHRGRGHSRALPIGSGQRGDTNSHQLCAPSCTVPRSH